MSRNCDHTERLLVEEGRERVARLKLSIVLNDAPT